MPPGGMKAEALERQTEALERQTEALERQTEALARQTEALARQIEFYVFYNVIKATSQLVIHM